MFLSVKGGRERQTSRAARAFKPEHRRTMANRQTAKKRDRETESRKFDQWSF
jgi:hypothetical protein